MKATKVSMFDENHLFSHKKHKSIRFAIFASGTAMLALITLFAVNNYIYNLNFWESTILFITLWVGWLCSAVGNATTSKSKQMKKNNSWITNEDDDRNPFSLELSKQDDLF